MSTTFNLYWIALEFFLGFSILGILTWGVIYIKLAGVFSQLRNLSNLALITLFICLLLLLNQYSIFLSFPSPISVADGALSIEAWNTLIKVLVTLMSLFLLVLSQYSSLDFEYIVLYLISLLGMYILVCSNDLLMMYLGLETLSLSLYILAAFNKKWEGSSEGGLKYFILGALSSGLLIAGCVIVYLLTGETSIHNISLYLWFGGESAALEIGAILILVALLFKLGSAPFHMWVPDVYEGAPLYVTAYFAIVPKIATLGFLYKFWWGFASLHSIPEILIWCGLASILIGSIGAINQTKIKRLLAYSAIAHMGFLLLSLGAGTFESILAAFLYITIYMLMSLNTFSILLNKGFTYISDLCGLSRLDPVLAITVSLGFLSIAGIPPLAGFFSKYSVLLATVESGLVFASLLAILASVIGAFYYIRIVKWIYFKDSSSFLYRNIAASLSFPSYSPISLSNSIVIGFTFYFILTLCLYPAPITQLLFSAFMSGSLI